MRVTHTDISTVALADGTVLEQSPSDARWAGAYRVPFVTEPQPTFYQRHFYLMPGLYKKDKIRTRYQYQDMMTPYEKFRSLPEAEAYLKPGITLEKLDAFAT